MDAVRDRHGKTEQEFLREYDATRYFRPSVTVDALLFRRTESGIRLLLIRRGGHPFLGDYAFPGGFVEKDEPCEDAALRELCEETGIADVPLRQLVTASTPDRDPRWRNITVAFCAPLGKEPDALGGDDAESACWFDVAWELTESAATVRLFGEENFECRLALARNAYGDIELNRTRIVERGKLAFDHSKILAYLLDKLDSIA